MSSKPRCHIYLLKHHANELEGSQASFMEIFHGDGAKIDKLNEILCEKAGFPSCYSISTQTYTRKVDLTVADAVCAFGSTVQKIACDIRLLAHDKELEEPFEKDQIGRVIFLLTISYFRRSWSFANMFQELQPLIEALWACFRTFGSKLLGRISY